MANARKLRGLVTGAAALLLVIGLASASWAQVPSWQQERSKIKATLEETDPGALGRIAAATDRGVATMGLGQLSVYTYNFGLTTGRVFSSGRWMFPNVNGTNYSYIFVSSPAFGVEAGPWGGAQVFESTSETHSLSQIDWEAVDGSRGLLFSDPPVTTSGYPIFATSDLPLTWPSTGWPAPAGVIEVWDGPLTWDKWAIVGDRNSYAEFSDAYAARDNTGQSYALGIEVKQRAISYAGFNATFFQFEFTNTSSYNLTGVHIGQIADSGTPTTGDYTGYILYDESRQLLWVRSTSFDPATGTHTRSATNTTPASFVGTMWLESPTGNFRTNALGDTVGTPSQVLTRVALLDWSDAVGLADGEATMYGALSGRYELMTDRADYVWKISQNIGGSVGTPKYKQTSANFLAMYGTTGDAYYYVSSGPLAMPAGASFDYVLAAVAAYTEPDLLAAADKAIRSYNKQYKGPSPPPSPANFKANGVKAGPHGREYDSRLHAYETYYVPSGGVTLTWDMSLTMTVHDPLSGNLDFEGIRLYRSNDRGRSWGTGITDVSGRRVEWVPYWTWDLVDGIKGMDGLSFTDLGNDTGLVSSFVDTFNVYDGIEYWYAIAAYDQGEFDPVSGEQLLRSLESPRGNDPSFPAMISVIPGTRPSGWVGGGPTVPGAVAVLPVSPMNSNASVTVGVVDDSSIKDATYRLTFSYDSVFGIDSYPNWYGVTLENRTTGDTLCVDLLPEHSAIGVNLLPEFEGLQVAVNTDWNANPSASGRKSYSFPSRIAPYSGYEMSYGDTRFMNPTIHSNDVSDLAEVYCPIDILWSKTNTQVCYAYTRSGYAYRGWNLPGHGVGCERPGQSAPGERPPHSAVEPAGG